MKQQLVNQVAPDRSVNSAVPVGWLLVYKLTTSFYLPIHHLLGMGVITSLTVITVTCYTMFIHQILRGIYIQQVQPEVINDRSVSDSIYLI